MGQLVQYGSQVMLTTGLPGSGKTLSVIQRVKEWAESSKRPVYYHGITDLAPELGWSLLEDPNKWFEVPDGSIVVVDECQRFEWDRAWKPPAGSSSKIPQAVREMETLRHRGLNLVLISQGPMLLNPNVRRLCGLHYHVVRAFGLQKATIYEWNKVESDPDSASAKAKAIKHLWSYPKKVFDLYKSAEVHTIKRALPLRVKLLTGLLLVLPLLFYAAYRYVYVGKMGTAARTQTAAEAGPLPRSGGGGGGGNKVQTTAEYVAARTPRIAGLAMTAPVYDDITKPSIAPKPVACVATPTRCGCYTQQGTRMTQVADVTCRSIVANGYFDDAPDKVERGRESTRESFFEKQSRNGELLQAAVEPSRVGADENAPPARPQVGRGWSEPRQTVTPPPKR